MLDALELTCIANRAGIEFYKRQASHELCYDRFLLSKTETRHDGIGPLNWHSKRSAVFPLPYCYC